MQKTCRQGCQKLRIDKHSLRLIERACEIFSCLEVNSHLAADAAVNLRQKRGRNLHEGHAAHKACSSKAAKVTDNAAAQRQHNVAARHAAGSKLLQHVA